MESGQQLAKGIGNLIKVNGYCFGFRRFLFTVVTLIVLQLCGYEPDIEPPMVYGENDSSINISSNSTQVILLQI